MEFYAHLNKYIRNNKCKKNVSSRSLINAPKLALFSTYRYFAGKDAGGHTPISRNKADVSEFYGKIYQVKINSLPIYTSFCHAFPYNTAQFFYFLLGKTFKKLCILFVITIKIIILKWLIPAIPKLITNSTDYNEKTAATNTSSFFLFAQNRKWWKDFMYVIPPGVRFNDIYMDVADIHRELGIGPRTIYNMRNEGNTLSLSPNLYFLLIHKC